MDSPPAKRQKLDGDSNPENSTTVKEAKNSSSMENDKEFSVGIRAYVNDTPFHFQGVLKTRYTDFLVNEILPTGEVLHLMSTGVKKVGMEQTSNKKVAAEAERGEEVKHEKLGAAGDQEQANGGTEAQASASAGLSQSKEVSAGTEITEEVKTKLTSYLDEATATEVIALYSSIQAHPQRKPRDHPTVRFPSFTNDRTLRTEIHQFIRTTFSSRIDSSTDHDGTLILNASPRASHSNSNRGQHQQQSRSRGNKLSWTDRGGEYLHFTLYKENKDTMEVISYLTRQLKTNAKNFSFAGTKDRRAVTVQRCCAYRVEAERLAGVNRGLRGAALGDFEYVDRGLELGDLGGNEFVITLRDCQFDMDAMGAGDDGSLQALRGKLTKAMESLSQDGFLNYYGLQRFGTFSTSTDAVGRLILKGDFKGACGAILHFEQDALEAAKEQEKAEKEAKANGTEDEADDRRFGKRGFAGIGQDDILRAKAINHWRTTKRLNDSLDILPRKFSAESQIIRHLFKQPTDFLGALMNVQRNLRLMYVHAYQSYVWNMAATKRREIFGNKVVEGDLVLVNEHKDKQAENGTTEDRTMADADGEVIIEPEGADRAHTAEQMFERARALTAEEAASGLYSMHDVVLPQPGYDIEYPQNKAGLQYYVDLMAEDRLDPLEMRRKQRDWSLSGSYRKLVGRIGKNWSVDMRRYDSAEEQFVQTDMERVGRGDGVGDVSETGSQSSNTAQGSNIAVILKFQLGSSQYATMALRELSKAGITAHKPEFSGGR